MKRDRPQMYPELRDEAWLRERYLNRGMSKQEIAAELGCAFGTLNQAFARFDIPTEVRGDRSRYPLLKDEDWLRDQYEARQRTIPEIAAEVGCAVMSVQKALVRHGIPRRTPGLIRSGKQRADASHGRTTDGRKRKRYHHGYVKIHVPDHPDADKQGYIPEHRYVMEQHLGRRLPAGSVVHHIDSNGGNNDINNLALFLSQRAHRLFHNAQAKESER